MFDIGGEPCHTNLAFFFWIFVFIQWIWISFSFRTAPSWMRWNIGLGVYAFKMDQNFVMDKLQMPA